ncbi:MAG: ADP-ribosylglycohydrolase family protein [Anaerolineales bacterium]|nr:ADP-ribosylglycohydrolase family protein [Anaerolineales bacterium]
MLGAIAGDIIGSVYEYRPLKNKSFPLFCEESRFTDDTVLTIAVASAILNAEDYGAAIARFAERHPHADYGGFFQQWLHSPSKAPYNSWGNGSAMRVSSVGFAFNSVDEVLDEARKTAEVTHDHPEGIKGAQATALAVYLARSGTSKGEIKGEIHERFAYDLSRKLDKIRPTYSFDESCQGTVPEAIIAFLESDSFEDAIRNAVSLGGDSDTLACITGGIAQAFYKEIPCEIETAVRARLPMEFIQVLDLFQSTFNL